MAKPWHLPVVGILALLWNCFGAADYLMTRFRVPAWIGNMPEGMLERIDGYPNWMSAVWAIAIWVPVLAAILLLARRKSAALWFGIGLVFVLIAAVWNFLIATPPLNEVADIGVAGLWAGIIVIAGGEWLYARAMAQAGHLD